ncbi:MAG: hypothetical protein JSV05_03065 [Candidatus Bathyarchaeota archaeon]|nr:MAG: hypothetical protein JSV05_03065 [Candidatus Bathyarchaeota archaeon]
MLKKVVIVGILIVICVVAISLIVFLSPEDDTDDGATAKTFSISDSEQWIYEEFQRSKFQMVTYEENEVKMIFLVQVDWFLDHELHWQVNEGHWYKNGSRIAISSGLSSNFTGERLDSDYLLGGLPNLDYEVRFGDFRINISFNFDTVAYNNATHAWKSSELQMLWSARA